MKKKILVILLALVMVASLITAVACNKNGVAIDLRTNDWLDKDAQAAENPDAQASYKPSLASDGSLVVAYENVGEWQVMQIALTKFKLEDLEKVTALELTASADKDTRIMIKVEYLSNENFIECYADLKTTESTHTFDLTKAKNLSTALMISLFIEPGKTAPQGTVTFKQLRLVEKTEAEAKGETVIAALGEENVITSSSTKIANWYDWKNEAYTVSESNGVYTVNYKKVGEWNTLEAVVSGNAISSMKSIKVKLGGLTVGDKVLIKLNAKEKTFDVTAAEQEFILDIVGVENASKVGIIMAPGNATAQGSFTILSAEFSTAAAPAEPETPVVNENLNTITAENKAIAKWYGEAAFTVTHNQDGTVSVVKAANGSWAQLKADVTGAAIANMKSFKIKVIGEAGAPIIVKPWDNAKVQQEVNCTGEQQEIICDLTKYDGAALNYESELKILIFYNWDGAAKSNLKIVSAEFSTDSVATQPEPDDVNEITAENNAITKWTANSIFAISESEGVITVNYNKGTWDTLQAKISGDISSYTSVKITIKAKVDDQFMIKTNVGGNEETFTLKAAEEELTFNLPSSGTVEWIGIIPAPNTACEGTFQIVSAEFSKAVVVDPNMNEITAENKAITKWMTTSVYTVTESEGIVSVNYNKTEWDTLEAKVSGSLTSMVSIKIKLKGTVGDSFLIKYQGADLKTVTLESAEQEFVLAITPTAESTTVGIIPAPNTVCEGSFQIISAEFSTEAAPSTTPEA